MTSLDGLIERVRAATGPDRGIDRDIAERVAATKFRTGKRGREWFEDSHGGVETWTRHPTPYTASVDAALALVERMLPGWCNSTGLDADDQCWAYVWSKKRALSPPEGQAEGMPSRPLAILLALLTALNHQAKP